jgi:UDP-N-acetylmuramyl pentapeptide phosphotransferase/UDP-N-acetylglucosamine-1-phosphate transferase
MDEPGIRSSHLRKIPNLGGIAIFIPSESVLLFLPTNCLIYKFLFASLVILLYIGVMDDIVVMRAYKKLVAQIVVSSFIVIGSDIRIRSFSGFSGL